MSAEQFSSLRITSTLNAANAVLYPLRTVGLPVFGFGLLLAVWAVASAALLAWLVRRQGFNADTRSYAQVLAVLGVAIAWVLPLLCEPRGLPIRGYGMMMLLAVLSGMGLAVYRARRVGVDPEMIFALAFWMIVPGILGARAVYVCEYWSEISGRCTQTAALGLDLRHRQRPRRRAGGLRRVFRRHARAGVVLVAASRAALGYRRSDRPQHALGPGPGARRLPVERLLLRRSLRSALESDFSLEQPRPPA